MKNLFILLLCLTPSILAQTEKEMLDSNPELKNLVCLTQAMSPVHNGGKYGCPGQGGGSGAKTLQSPAGKPVGIRKIEEMFKWLRYQIMGPVVVRRSNYQAAPGEDCLEGIQLPLDFDYGEASYEKCIAAFYHDMKYHEEDLFPLTSLHQCQDILCEKGTLEGIKDFLKNTSESKIKGPVENFLKCPVRSYDI